MRHSLLLTFAVTVFVTTSILAADWPIFRGPNQSGISTETVDPQLIARGVTPQWKAKVGTGFSAIAVAGGRAYTMGNEEATDTIWCLDAVTGKEIWKHSYPEELKPNLYEGGPNAAPTVSGDRVYTISKTGKAFCLDAAKGDVIWESNLADLANAKKPEWGFSGSPLIEGDLIIYNAGSAGAALRKDSGKLAWKSGREPAGYSTPLPFSQGDKRLVMLVTGNAAVALQPGSGEVIWSYPWKTSYDINAADPIVMADKAFISSGYNHGAAVLQLTDGEPSVVWENKNLRNQFSSSVLWDGFLYGVDDKQLRCVDFATGDVKWSDSATGKGTLLIASGTIVALSEKGELIMAKATPDGFNPQARAQILGGKCWTMPSLADGRLYARNAKGDLVCVAVSEK